MHPVDDGGGLADTDVERLDHLAVLAGAHPVRPISAVIACPQSAAHRRSAS
ncbi:hypothetical protein NJ7G_0622 [Natrinema sp. J7-2]|nr:hypothetical protein NJ7G_0622 [Natrinema sp. J7-2]